MDQKSKTCINFTRSSATCLVDEFGRLVHREQENEITAFVDGSQVYGSTDELAKKLRSSDGIFFHSLILYRTQQKP